MEIEEWGQDEQQGRRPHTSRLQDEINIKFSIIRRSPVYNPVTFYVIHPRGRVKNKTMRVIFHLFIHIWPDIFEGNLRTSRIAVEMRQKKKKIRVKFHTTRALPIRSCCQKSKSATRATACLLPFSAGRNKRIPTGAARKCQASDKNQHAGDKK